VVKCNKLAASSTELKIFLLGVPLFVLIRETEFLGILCTFTEHSMLKAKTSAKQAANEHFVSKRAARRHRDDSTVDSTTGCTCCGRSNHQVLDCNSSKSQLYNKTTDAYHGSEAYNKLIAYNKKYIPGQRFTVVEFQFSILFRIFPTLFLFHSLGFSLSRILVSVMSRFKSTRFSGTRVYQFLITVYGSLPTVPALAQFMSLISITF
jgi:hypothetical protein